MAEWARKLDVSDVWQQAKDYEISIQELSRIVEQRLRAVENIGDHDLDYTKEELADEFKDLAEDEEADNEWFNDIWSRLYDWGDTPLDNNQLYGKKVCWISTFK